MILEPARTKLVYNGVWLGALRFDDVIKIAGKHTLARMMERDDFKKRWAEHASIGLHELLYPLAQAYDSVELRCDVELGGTDQLFNLMLGREMMREHGQPPQIVMTTPILEGTNARVEGSKIVGDKMSKSLDNYVGVGKAPEMQLGKLMSIADGVMWRYYELLSSLALADIKSRREACERGEANPKDAKMALAREIVTRFHGEDAAEEATRKWEAQFSRREVPEDMPEKTIRIDGEVILISKALAEAAVVKSGSEARRRIQAGAVSIDGTRVSDEKATLERGKRYVVRAGKRDWAAITIEAKD
jgi:tyrosyl-tRNA synthetase